MAQAVMVAEPQALTAAATTMVAESLAAVNINEDVHKKNRIQVSNTKKPLFFYLNLAKTTYGRAKRYIKQYNDVELSALGMAIPTVVTISEMLKANGTVVEKKVLTSTVGSKDENKGRFVQKAKIEIVLEKSDKSPTSADATTKCVLKTETKAVSDERKEKGESNIESENADKKEG